MIKTYIKTVILIGLCVSFLIPAFADNKLDPFQVWQGNHVEYSGEKWNIMFGQEIRFGGDAGFYRTHTDVELTNKQINWLHFTLGYKQVYSRDTDLWNKWKVEYRPDLRAKLILDWKEIEFSNHHRIEYRVLENKDDEWRYRTSLEIIPKKGWTKFNIKPYISDEIVLDFYGDGLARNRLYSGIKLDAMEYLKFDIYYLFQTAKISDKWPVQNVLGINLKVSF